MVLFKIHRGRSEEPATGFDMGDIELSFDGEIVSSRGNPRFSNMIYVSMVNLIDDLLQLQSGGRSYEFIGADSSFAIRFEKNRQGIYVCHGKSKYGPLPLSELFKAVSYGIDEFLSHPHNEISTESSMYDDFNASRSALKNVLS